MKFLKIEVPYLWVRDTGVKKTQVHLVNIAHIIEITPPKYIDRLDRWSFYVEINYLEEGNTCKHELGGNENTEESCMEKYNEIVSKLDVI